MDVNMDVVDMDVVDMDVVDMDVVDMDVVDKIKDLRVKDQDHGQCLPSLSPIDNWRTFLAQFDLVKRPRHNTERLQKCKIL